MASLLLSKFSQNFKNIVTLNARIKLIQYSSERFLHFSPLKAAKTLRVNESKLPTKLALNHFDDFYETVFGEKWHSIRLALLCQHKYCAVINPYVGETKIVTDLGAHNIKHFINSKPNKNVLNINSDDEEIEYEVLDKENQEPDEDYTRYNTEAFMPVSEVQFREEIINEGGFSAVEHKLNAVKEVEPPIKFPTAWKIYAFPKGDISRFPPPTQDGAGYLNYYLMDAASLLPVWALDIQPGEDVADICASPGGKSLAMAYTMCPGSMFLVDNSASRIKRLHAVLNCFLPNQASLKTVINVAHMDGREILPQNFDKVLVDAPCTNDRVSVTFDDNNYFQPKRLKERIKIPETQTELLISGLKSLRNGGSLVYSTCSLSPAQNDGVVHLSLAKIMDETGNNFVVRDLKMTFAQITGFMSIKRTNYGSLVLPHLSSNFGPMYISKITRMS